MALVWPYQETEGDGLLLRGGGMEQRSVRRSQRSHGLLQLGYCLLLKTDGLLEGTAVVDERERKKEWSILQNSQKRSCKRMSKYKNIKCLKIQYHGYKIIKNNKQGKKQNQRR